MNIDIIATGLMALAVWGFVWRRSLKKGPLSWCSPTALFATGIMILYIVPSLYWQFRPWPYYVPPYFEDISLVMVGAFILGLPFVFYDLVNTPPNRPNLLRPMARPGDFNWLLWCLVIPIFLGMGLRIFLLTIGWQARLAREMFTIAGSDSVGLIVLNFVSYYPLCYFGLAAFGNRTQRRVGKIIWVLDGCLMFWTLHRYELLIYLLYSLIFLRLQGWRPRLRHLALGSGAVVFTIAIIGQTPIFTTENLSFRRAYLDPLETLNVVIETFSNINRGDDLYGKWGHSSPGAPTLKAIDDTMYRLYDARSAAAVMGNVPKIIPYFYGETFLHILYAYIPRYFWEGKPMLNEVHRVTTWVMPDDEGINPTGTIAEFYMNFGFIGILLGGGVCLALCRWGENSLNRPAGIGPALYCVYPVLSLYFVWASETFSRRIAESLRTLLVIGLLTLVFRLAARRRREAVRSFPNRAPASISGLLPVLRRPV